MSGPVRVLVLGGGPDAEREVSLNSSRAVADALASTGRHEVDYRVIDRPDASELDAMGGDVVFPVLHGPWGEGGPMQDLLESIGRPYVGCGPVEARFCMDKLATKLEAARAGVPTLRGAILNPSEAAGTVLPLPTVIKPTHEGSSVGLRICNTHDEYLRAARACAQDRSKVWLIEPCIRGRELTVGVLSDGVGGYEALQIVEIAPVSGVYDYDAKYVRKDTVYTVAPELPSGVADAVRARAVEVCKRIGVRHLARVDFILEHGPSSGAQGEAWFLEINTMPGFTPTSLLPKAAAHAGMDLAALASRLVEAALRSGASAGVC